MRIAVMMIAVIVLLFSCGDQDEKPPEELVVPGPTAVKGPGAAEIRAAASAGGVAPTNQVTHSSEAAPAGDTAQHDPDNADYILSPRRHVPAPLRLRIIEATTIVRATLITSLATTERYSASDGTGIQEANMGSGERLPVDGEYRAVHSFQFRVSEYLKGAGASEITVTVRSVGTHGTEAQALQAASVSLRERDMSRDQHQAVLFLLEPSSNAAFRFLRSGPYPSLHYTINTMNRVWLPAKDPHGTGGTSSSSNDSSLLFFTSDPSDPSPSTISLGDLRSEITAVDALIAAGDGTEEYSECIVEGWRYEQTYPESRVPPEDVYQLESGTPEGTEVKIYVEHFLSGYDRKLIQGRDKDLFKAVLNDDDNRPETGYTIGEATARPLPAGTYQYNRYTQGYQFIPCNFIPYNSNRIRNVVVTAPSGTLHELFFDPVTVGSTVVADATNGVLMPTSFTDSNGASATINSISYESSTVKMTLSPHTGLTNHIVDIIELDGTVSLSLDVAEAAVDAANNTMNWSVPPSRGTTATS